MRVSVGSPAPEVQGVARLSEDGSHVYFVAKGVLTVGTNREGREPVAGANNLYVFERDAADPGGRLTFIATLSSETQAELAGKDKSCAGPEKEECEEAFQAEARRVNRRDEPDWEKSDYGRPVQATPDGRFLVFSSAADLTPGDTAGTQQIFEYDAQSEQLVRVSIGQTPSETESANTNGATIPIQPFTAAARPPAVTGTSLAVSGDGAVVVFASAGALTPSALRASEAGAESVYEYRSSGSLSNGAVNLVSDGGNTESAYAVGLDASGNDVFFSTTDPLLVQDVDTQRDLYDARVDGGFPAPVAVAGCEGEACQGGASLLRPFGVPGSANLTADGNVASPAPTSLKPPTAPRTTATRTLKCKRGFTKRKSRCVNNEKRRARAGRAANHRGGHS